MNNPHPKGGLLLPAIYAMIIMSLLALSGCGKEGPLGNTPGPKKPVWSYDFDPMH
jgi:predicted small lipoprotein YifL